MKYGIICAMEEEIALLKNDIEIKNVTVIANREFIEGKLYNNDVVLVQSRIGKVASASTVTTLIDKYKPDCVVFCGTAGAVAGELGVGDVVIADKLCQHDFFTGQEYFQIPLLNVSYFETDKQVTKRMYNAVKEYVENEMKNTIPKEYLDSFNIKEPKVVLGTIASGDQFICETEKRNWILENVENCKCAEMEGAAVAQICYEYGVPLAVMRVISDSANEASNVDFEEFVEEAGCHFTRGIMRAFLVK